tara:strand:+ start:202 stop:975 length:774 start_codon:yes stop_codon:yes gene_type:complete
MTNHPSKNQSSNKKLNNEQDKIALEESRKILSTYSAEERIAWASNTFSSGFALTTSFGIQSAVLLNMLHNLSSQPKPKVIWVDTGYLPPETYQYADTLSNKLNLDLVVAQSPLSPARMEAIYGRLWETNSLENIEKYHLIRKVDPLEKALENLKVTCWASGVRGGQTKHRRSMSFLDPIRGRLSLRPILEWTKKDIFYYMKENNLPQHPLFEKGYSTVGDWHSSAPDGVEKQGRETRFGGHKEECGIHTQGEKGEGI